MVKGFYSNLNDRLFYSFFSGMSVYYQYHSINALFKLLEESQPTFQSNLKGFVDHLTVPMCLCLEGRR